MEKFREQSQRLEMVLYAKGEYSVECDKCPIREQCHAWCETLDGEEPGVSCEDVLAWYIIHGDFIPTL